jgi:hypothetical protein
MWQMAMRNVSVSISSLLLCGGLCVAAGAALPAAGAAALPAPADIRAVGQAAAADALWQEARRQYDSFNYDAAILSLDQLVAALAAATPPNVDLLAQAYELRARARFAKGDTASAESDFARLLEVRPDFTLAAGVSPRVVGLFTNVRNRTVGELLLSMTPAGEVTIGGRVYAVDSTPQSIKLLQGPYAVTANLRGYRPVAEAVQVAAAGSTTLALTPDRISATVAVTTLPDGVHVELDGASRGVTTAGDVKGEASAPLILDLQTGVYRLTLKRECYVTLERELNVDRLASFTVGPLELVPAVASVAIQADVPDATVYLDGVARGSAPAELKDICEGDHTLELRSPRGRFVDRQRWRAGDSKTIKGTLRPAFAIVGFADAGSGALVPPQAITVERALPEKSGMLLFAAAESDVKVALEREKLQPLDLSKRLTDAQNEQSRRQVREIGRRLSDRLDVQGLAWVTPVAGDPEAISLSLLTSDSASPDVLTFRPRDPVSRGQALAALLAPPPRPLRRTLDLAAVDVADVTGAVVLRPAAGAADAPGALLAGEVVVAAGGQPVKTVSDLRASAAALPAPGPLNVDVRGRDGRIRAATITVGESPDLVSYGDRTLLCNKLLLEMRNLVQATRAPQEQTAARLNLAVAEMCVAGWEDALVNLEQVMLPDGAGVSAGTVTYLMGLCYEALGRVADARSAFERAAGAAESTLGLDGPSVHLLAQQKLTLPR